MKLHDWSRKLLVIEQHVDKFNQEIKNIEVLDFITRDDNLQNSACLKLKTLWEEAKALKIGYAQKGETDAANLFLGFQFVISQLYNKLNMWLCLKKQDPEKAWEHLIKAQRKCREATCAHKGFQHLSAAYERLVAIEKLIFPPQIFLSSGLLVGKLVCSICHSDYEECNHISGKAYNGMLCGIIEKDIRGDHVAIVDHPEDKRCRITSFTNSEGIRNRMTWSLKPLPKDTETIPDGELLASAIIIVASGGKEEI